MTLQTNAFLGQDFLTFGMFATLLDTLILISKQKMIRLFFVQQAHQEHIQQASHVGVVSSHLSTVLYSAPIQCTATVTAAFSVSTIITWVWISAALVVFIVTHS